MDGKWIGVDFDGTLAFYDEWRGSDHVGEPIQATVDRVLRWIKDGEDVRIFTARADDRVSCQAINRWSLDILGKVLPITNKKDKHCKEIWDDKAHRVETNTGRCLSM